MRSSQQDKEYHFQNWVKRRIEAVGLAYDELGRHGYPDFVLAEHPSGYEVKGLAYPGRSADFDCNSQLPLATQDGKQVYYIFGRYPVTREQEFPVHDIVLCSAAFLNAQTENTNTNQSFRGAGSYGDILIRDRRMYVCATPYALAPGTVGQATLILNSDEVIEMPQVLEAVGRMQRVESRERVTGYSFDLLENTLRSERGINPHAGQVHAFSVYRVRGYGTGAVSLVERGA
ncbi:MAG: hypothetical protein HC765_03655 [Brachymonas sp.]|nr:hypothetical protein [Brachymonas sp.]